VGKPGGVRYAIVVVIDGEDARVIAESRVFENLQCPQGLSRYGVGGCPVADDGVARCVLEDLFGPGYVIAELLRGLPVDNLVCIPVAGNLVSLLVDPPYEPCVALCDPAETEKGAPDPVLFQEVEDPGCVFLHGRRNLLPRVLSYDAGEHMYLEILLNVDAQGVGHCRHYNVFLHTSQSSIPHHANG